MILMPHRTSLLTLSQVTGTLQCLEKLVKKKVAIPPATIRELEVRERTLDNGVRQLEVADLLPGDLDPFEEVEAGAVGARLGVDSCRPLICSDAWSLFPFAMFLFIGFLG